MPGIAAARVSRADLCPARGGNWTRGNEQKLSKVPCSHAQGANTQQLRVEEKRVQQSREMCWGWVMGGEGA